MSITEKLLVNQQKKLLCMLVVKPLLFLKEPFFSYQYQYSFNFLEIQMFILIPNSHCEI